MAVNYQMVYDGLTFGLGTNIGIEVISGFENFEVRSADSPIPRGWGDVPGLHTVNSREVVLQLTAASDADFKIIMDTFQPTDTPTELYLIEPETGERFVYARPIGRAFIRNPLHKFKKMVAIRLKLADPRLYGVQHVHAIPLFDAGGGGGAEYAFDYGIDFVGGASGDTTVINDGNIDAYPNISIFAPSSGTTLTATITNLTTGQLAEFTFSTDLNPGDLFTANMQRIVAVAPGGDPYINLSGTNRYGDWDLPRTPLALIPGANDIRFEISGTGVDAAASLTYRDTSL